MNNITIMELAQWAYDNIVKIFILLSIFVEITPIRFNPISWVVNILFKPLKKDMNDMKKELNDNIIDIKTELKQEIEQIKVETQKEKESINELVKANEMVEISRIRWEIIEFSNTIENNQLHIRDEYRHIIDDNRRYHALIEKYELDDGFIDEEYEKILSHYNRNKNSNRVYF